MDLIGRDKQSIIRQINSQVYLIEYIGGTRGGKIVLSEIYGVYTDLQKACLNLHETFPRIVTQSEMNRIMVHNFDDKPICLLVEDGIYVKYAITKVSTDKLGGIPRDCNVVEPYDSDEDFY